MATIKASLFTALDGVVDPDGRQLALPVLQRRDGRGRGRHPRRRRHALRPRRPTTASPAPGRTVRPPASDDAEFAKQLGDMRKIVASRSPLEFTWRNSEQLRGRPRRGGHRAQGRPVHPPDRVERIDVGRAAAARRRPRSTSSTCSCTRRPPVAACACSTTARPSATSSCCQPHRSRRASSTSSTPPTRTRPGGDYDSAKANLSSD